MARKLKYPAHMKTIKSESSSYQIEFCLGEGLSSRVYRAKRFDSRGHSEQTLVLKILKNKKQVECLRQEFDALSRLDSQYCVRVLNWENLDGGPALVLEYIDGITLFELLTTGALEDAIVDEILSQVQLGLAALENVGRFHGDLNLKNIMIDKNGVVKLIDFATSYSDQMLKQELIGTPQYLAPEVWRGEPRTIKSDLFALGLIASDILKPLCHLPEAKEDCITRAQAVMDSDPYFFSHDPQRRTYKKISPNTSAKKFLATKVTQIMSERLYRNQQTQILDSKKKRSRKFQITSLCILAISCFVIPGVSTPIIKYSPTISYSKKAVLEIRTSQWIQVLLDGKNYGFAPITIDKVNPGVHRLKWTSAKASGEMKFKLESGEFRLLSERDFIGLIKRQKKTSERHIAGYEGDKFKF